MAESKDLWFCVCQLADALEAHGATLNSRTTSVLGDFSQKPREVQEKLLKRLAEVAVSSTALVSLATSHLAVSKGTQPSDL